MTAAPPPSRRRISHASSINPGRHAAVANAKKGAQPKLSASHPPDVASTVRAVAASADSSAYCVAVKAGLHRPER